MVKFHIGRKGKPTRCRAKEGNCPFGDESQHYSSIEEATKNIEKTYNVEHEIFSSTKKAESNFNFKDNLVEKLANIDYKLIDKGIYDFFNEHSDEIFNIIRENKARNDIDDYDKQNEYKYFANSVIEELSDNKLSSLGALKEKVYDSMNDLEYDENQIRAYEADEKLPDYKTEKNFRKTVIEISKNSNMGDDEDTLKKLGEILENDDFEISKMKDIGNGFVNMTVKDKEWEIRKFNIVMYLKDGAKNLTSNRIYLNDDFHFQPYYTAKVFDKLTDKEIETIVDNGNIGIIKYEGGKTLDSNGDNINIQRFFDSQYKEKKQVIGNSLRKQYLKAEKACAIIDKESFLERDFINTNISHVGNSGLEKAEFYKTAAPKTGIKKDVSKLIKSLETDKELNKVKQELSGNIEHLWLDNSRFSDRELSEVDYNIAGLSKEEKDSINEYSGGSYGIYTSAAFNSRFEKEDSFSEEESLNRMKTINNALKKIQKGNTNNRVLYRGFAGPEHMTTKEFIKSYDIGDEVITQKITSTSLSPEVAKSFSKKAIHCPSIFVYRSKKGAYIKDLSSSPQEEEVVIPVGEKMIVTHKEVNENGIAIIYLSDSDEVTN